MSASLDQAARCSPGVPLINPFGVHLHRESVWFVGVGTELRDSAINDFLRKLGLSRPRGSNPEPVVYKTDRTAFTMSRLIISGRRVSVPRCVSESLGVASSGATASGFSDA